MTELISKEPATETGNPQIIPSAVQEPVKLPLKKKRSTLKVAGVIGLMVGSLVIFVIGMIVFQPYAYLSLLKRQSEPQKEIARTRTVIYRNIEPRDPSAGTEAYSDSVTITSETQHVAPDTWSFSTRVKSAQSTTEEGDGIDALIFSKDEAYQRYPGEGQTYQPFQFSQVAGDAVDENGNPVDQSQQVDEYAETIRAIRTSLFQNQLLDYVYNPRFVWKSDGKPWWQPHYRYTIAVGNIEADSPDWYDASMYPFAVEPALGSQKIVFTLDVWLNPLTGKVMNEVWQVHKETLDADIYFITLDVTVDRQHEYPADLEIAKPS